jgi:hypothetical protein
MKNTFRYALNIQDYINFEKMQFKRANSVSMFFIIIFCLGIAIYNYITLQDMTYIIGTVLAVVLLVLCVAFYFSYGIKNKVLKYTSGDSSYLAMTELSVTDSTIETNNLPNQNEAGIVAIYPYSIMNVIYESEEYFYFYIGYEVKILPKSVIPQEMKEQVFKQIKSNPNCIKLK